MIKILILFVFAAIVLSLATGLFAVLADPGSLKESSTR